MVRDLTFSISSGEAVQLFGENGSGKSTILQAIAGLIQPAQGSINWAHNDSTASIHTELVYAGHLNALKLSLTVFENLVFWAKSYGIAEHAIAAALEQLEISPLKNVKVGHLSAGQKRRVSIARCLMSGRLLWLLDEPTASLDEKSQGLVTEIIKTHLNAGGIGVIATHTRLDILSTDILLAKNEVMG